MSLFNIKLTVSAQRSPEVKSVNLFDKVELLTWGAVHMSMVNTDFFPSSFCLKSGDQVIYIDPVMISSGPKANLILITHDHPDHFSPDDIEKLCDVATIIIAPKKVVKKLRGYDVKLARPGSRFELSSCQIDAVPAYSLGFPSHSKSNENVGYVITIAGMSIYHAGDTDLVPEIEKLSDIDVALIPIDGGNLTMSTKDAADLTIKLNPKMVIPMHYVVNQNKADEFAKMIPPKVEVRILAA